MNKLSVTVMGVTLKRKAAQIAVLRTAVLYQLHDKATGAIAKAAAPVLCSIRGFCSFPGYSF